MSELKATKGPWVITHDAWDDEKWQITNDLENRRVEIAHVDTGYSGEFGKEQEANAHLIAAAPCLYEACRQAQFELEHFRLSASADELELIEDAMNKIAEAMAKARGEQP